jgi:hypothetical protein
VRHAVNGPMAISMRRKYQANLVQTLAIGLSKEELGEEDKGMHSKKFQHRCGMVGHHLSSISRRVSRVLICR